MIIKLLITCSTQKPHEGVSKDTVSRWVKKVMIKASIKDCFSVHSTHAAATSAARLHGVPISTIRQTAGWSNARTFKKFYHKTISCNPAKKSFQQAVLESTPSHEV